MNRYELRRLVRMAGETLARAGVASGEHDARVLAEDLLGCPLLMVDEAPAGFAERFEELIRRRATREPLQHIMGRMWFRGLELQATPGVFLVRPETEVVAGDAIEHLRACLAAGVSQPVAVDLCTGSGAIAAALASEVAQARIIAVDIDALAAQAANANCERHAPGRVEVIRADATSPSTLAHLDGLVDVVVSNPPYVPPGAVEDEETARFDPPLALFGGGDGGLDIPTAIIARASHLARPGGWLIMEHDPSQSEALRACAQRCGWVEVRTCPDLTGRDRYLMARRRGEC